MKKSIVLFSTILILLFIQSCKDFNFHEDVLQGTSNFTWERDRPVGGVINPSNTNELIYRWTDSALTGPRYELRKRNLLTGKDEAILEDVWGELSWSKNGWLAFRRTDNQVWVMKDDGSGLERLTQSFLDKDIGTFDPSISPDGDKIVFYYSDNFSHIGIIDRKNKQPYDLVDSIYSPEDPEYSPNGEMIAYITGKYNNKKNMVEGTEILNIYDLNNKSTRKICELPQNEPVSGVSWKGNEEVLVNTNEYIYLIDINTGEWKRIFEDREKIGLNPMHSIPSNHEKFLAKVSRVKHKKLGKEAYGDMSLEIWSFDDMKKVEELIP